MIHETTRDFRSRYNLSQSGLNRTRMNPDIIYVGTSDLNPYSSLLPSAKGIYKSTNGGSEWTSVGGPYTGKWIFKTFCSISSIVVNPTDPDTVYAGTVGGGIWRTKNGGKSWEKIWDEPVNKETLLDVNALAISLANPNTIYAAAYNFDPVNAMGWSGILIPNRFIKSEDGGDTWERLRLGILTAAPKIDDIAVDYKNVDIVYVITEHYKVYNSTDGGKNWDDASGTGGSNPLPYVFRPWSLWKSGSMSIHPDYSNVIYASGEWGFKYVYFSSDSGENWFPFRDLKDKHVKEIVLASNADSHVIYAAAVEGLFKVDISEPEENEMMIKVVDEGDYVRVDYIGKLEDGTVFDTSMKDIAIDAGIYNQKRDYQPLGFTVGAGEMIKGFDKGVVGMVVGEDKTLTIPADQAYGPYRADLVQVVARDQLPPDSELEVGQMLQASQPNDQIILVTITNVTDSNVTLDANHRLAGKTLIFDVTLVSIGGE